MAANGPSPFVISSGAKFLRLGRGPPWRAVDPKAALAKPRTLALPGRTFVPSRLLTRTRNWFTKSRESLKVVARFRRSYLVKQYWRFRSATPFSFMDRLLISGRGTHRDSA